MSSAVIRTIGLPLGYSPPATSSRCVEPERLAAVRLGAQGRIAFDELVRVGGAVVVVPMVAAGRAGDRKRYERGDQPEAERCPSPERSHASPFNDANEPGTNAADAAAPSTPHRTVWLRRGMTLPRSGRDGHPSGEGSLRRPGYGCGRCGAASSSEPSSACPWPRSRRPPPSPGGRARCPIRSRHRRIPSCPTSRSRH